VTFDLLAVQVLCTCHYGT